VNNSAAQHHQQMLGAIGATATGSSQGAADLDSLAALPVIPLQQLGSRREVCNITTYNVT
jgi:hypothetical protein